MTASLALLAGLTGAAILLYGPARRIGLLADDFTLLQWARELQFFPSNWEYIRPLPLMIWSIVVRILPGEAQAAMALHLLNVCAHGLNAWLVWRLAGRLAVSRAGSMFAATFFLFSPLAVEPVVWCSAMSDVLMTTCALAMCLIVTRRLELTVGEQAISIVLGAMMIAAKETGVVAAALVLLVRWARWGPPGLRAYGVGGALTIAALAYAGWRALSAQLDPELTPVPDVESVRRLLTQSFGAMIVPLHADVIHEYPPVATVLPIAFVLLLATWICRWRRDRNAVRIAMLAVTALLVCTAPTIRAFGVLDDLQGSRYLYLPAAFWSIALGSAFFDGWPLRTARVGAAVLAAITIAGAAFAVHAHFAPWQQARRVRDVVRFTLASLPRSCVRVHAGGLPDHVRGAYVFRNGVTEALAASGRAFEFVREIDAAPECRVDLSESVKAGR